MRYSGSAPAVSLPEGGGGLPILNHSSIAEWLRCRYRYDLATNRKIHSRAVIRPLEMGSAVHVGLDAALRDIAAVAVNKLTSKKIVASIKKATIAIDQWAAGQEKIRGGRLQMVEEEVVQMEEILDMAPVIVARAIEFINPRRWRTVTLEGVPAIELGIQIPFAGWGGFHGTIDWLAEDLEEGGQWIWDYKVRKQFHPEEAEEVDLQMPVYQKLLFDKYGVETVGAIKFQAKSAVPKTPSLNKDGRVSRADIATDWDTYKQFVIEAGLDPDDYLDMKDKLRHEFFRMTPVYRSMSEVERLWKTVVRPAAHDLRVARDRGFNKKDVFRHFGYMNCQGCWARHFCLAEVHDEDTAFLLQTKYIDLDDPAPRLVLNANDLIDDRDDP